MRGLITAIVTPFNGEKIDYDGLNKIVLNQIESGVESILFFGSTGELPTLSEKEFYELSQFVYNNYKNKVKILAGIGGNNTKQCILNANVVKNFDGIMAVVPFYNKPRQSGIKKHFEEIAKATSLPIMLYSVPSRTGSDFEDETLEFLSHISNIVALKDSSGSTKRIQKIQSIDILCGDDNMIIDFALHKYNGFVSVLSNLAPKTCIKLHNSILKQDWDVAIKTFKFLLKIYDIAFKYTNPIVVKFLLSYMGYIKDDVRLPLDSLLHSEQINIKTLWKKVTEDQNFIG